MATMRNTAEIAEKILACIPEGQPDKEDENNNIPCWDIFKK